MENLFTEPINHLVLSDKIRSLGKTLRATTQHSQPIRIAVLCGSSCQDILQAWSVFLMQSGYNPQFYSSGFNRVYEESVLDTSALKEFSPQCIYIHTTIKNHPELEQLAPSSQHESTIQSILEYYSTIWNSLCQNFSCPIIQNNIDWPTLLPGGNLCSKNYNSVENILHLNLQLSQKALAYQQIFMHDIFTLSAQIGAQQWFDYRYWYAWKFAIAPQSVTQFSHHLHQLFLSLSSSICKCIVVDLDHTLWGGVLAEAGPQGIALGGSTPMGEAYSHFQSYLKNMVQHGILLAICSKNNPELESQIFTHTEMILTRNDFACIRINWQDKAQNIQDIAQELNIGLAQIVFVDDNPTERGWVESRLPMVKVPNIGGDPSYYPLILQQSGWFITCKITQEDSIRNELYQQNLARTNATKLHTNYKQFLQSLKMQCTAQSITATNSERCSQLLNKTHQFNLTQIFCSGAELLQCAKSSNTLALCYSLSDIYGSNGIVSVLYGTIKHKVFWLTNWVMSCRVFDRGLEDAIMDHLQFKLHARGVNRMTLFLHPTPKNQRFSNIFSQWGFQLLPTQTPSTTWSLAIKQFKPNTHFIYLKDDSNA
jgi:FkbH-like protein